MSVRTVAAAAVLATGSWLLVGAAPALAVCDAYSGGCPSTPPTTGVGGGGTDIGGDTEQPGSGSGNEGTAGGPGGGTTSNGGTLPFTGGELVLMSAIGVGTLAGGTALVVAGRRRSQPSV